jgi:hypothetical protein
LENQSSAGRPQASATYFVQPAIPSLALSFVLLGIFWRISLNCNEGRQQKRYASAVKIRQDSHWTPSSLQFDISSLPRFRVLRDLCGPELFTATRKKTRIR